MKALFLRFYRFTGVMGLLMVLLGGLMMPLIVFGGWSAFSSSSIFAVKAIGLFIIAVGVAMKAAGQYKRSSHTVGHEDILLPLVHSEREYCLVLRPFGRDGEIIVPKASRRGRVGIPLTYFTRNATMEQLVAVAARSTLDLETYGIVNQKVLLAPPGVTFMRASSDDWKMVAQCLIRRAHTIVLIVHPDREIREGFAWEIEEIVRCGMQSRVVLVLPPCDQDVYDHPAALLRACVLLALLDDSGRQAELNQFKVHEYELQLSPTTLLVRYNENAGTTSWLSEPNDNARQNAVAGGSRREKREEKRKNRKKRFVVDTTYLPGFIEAFKGVEHELSELGFKARYRLK